MSRRVQHSNNRRQATPFCKVCFDSGKSEAIFTGHFTKNRDGKVTCQTILAHNCKVCGHKGHFEDHCRKGNKKEAPGAPIKNMDVRPITEINDLTQCSANLFDSLSVDDSTDSDKEPVKPQVSIKKRITNWADVDSSDDESV